MKKAKKVLMAMEPSPASRSGSGGGAGSRARFKYQSLLQDYEELVKETEAKRKRLLREKQKIQKLSAEVKFLRRKYKSLSENPSQIAVYGLKQPPALPSPWTHDEHRPVQVIGYGNPSRGQSSHGRQDFARRTSAVIDLNQACVPSSEEMEEFHGIREPVRADKAKKYPMEGDTAGANDVKMPICWDVRNAAGRVGKRKISWQDQLALKV